MTRPDLKTRLEKWKSASLGLGVLGTGLCVWAFVFQKAAFFQSYLVAFMFWLAISLGCYAVLQLHNLTGGEWGQVSRPLLVTGMRTLKIMPLFFLPLLLGLKTLYPWTHPEHMAAHEHLAHKVGYLNIPFFIGRAVFYFALWNFTAWVIERWLTRVEVEGQEEMRRSLQRRSAVGILTFVFSISFAAVDWGMSLDPEWTSTMYGMWFVVADGLSGFAFVLVMLGLMSEDEPFKDVVKPHNFHDLGTLMFAFIMLWAYFSFSQYLIIWCGNLAEEIPWLIVRGEGIWKTLGLILMVGHFAIPFFILLSRTVKRNRRLVSSMALGILVLRYVDYTWLLKPSMIEEGTKVSAFQVWDLAAMAAIGGLWMAYALQQLPSTLRYLPKETLSDDQFEEHVYSGVV